MIKSATQVILLLTLPIIFSINVTYAGIISKSLIKSGKYAGKETIQKGSKEGVVSIGENSLNNLSKKYGINIVEKVNSIAEKNTLDSMRILREIQIYGEIYKKAGFSEDALIFGIKNGEAGRFLLKNFNYHELKNSRLLDTDSKDVVYQLWRLGDENAIGGSIVKLKKAIKNSKIVENECFPCLEYLNLNTKISKISFANTSKKDIPKFSSLVKNNETSISSKELNNSSSSKRTIKSKDKEESNKSKSDILEENRAAGVSREKRVKSELNKDYPDKKGYKVQEEQYLRDKEGNIVKDKNTGEARRIDFVVIKDGKVVKSVEVTSLDAPKGPQSTKENRIREQGGNYIKDKDTGELIPFDQNVETEIERRT